jgi:hypothetical protein
LTTSTLLLLVFWPERGRGAGPTHSTVATLAFWTLARGFASDAAAAVGLRRPWALRGRDRRGSHQR